MRRAWRGDNNTENLQGGHEGVTTTRIYKEDMEGQQQQRESTRRVWRGDNNNENLRGGHGGATTTTRIYKEGRQQ